LIQPRNFVAPSTIDEVPMSGRRFQFPDVAAPPTAIGQTAFVAFPVILIAGGYSHFNSIHEIYRAAYEQACETNRPSRWQPLYEICPN
jgi:hypothetical protein